MIPVPTKPGTIARAGLTGFALALSRLKGKRLI